MLSIRTIFAVIVLSMIETAYSQVAEKGLPPISGKTQVSDKRSNSTNGKQEITVNPPSNSNASLDSKVDIKSQNDQTGAHDESGKWADPVTWFTLVLAVANILLWLTTKNLVTEAKTASGIARDAANAARDYADAAVKSVMPVLFPYVTDMTKLHPLTASDSSVTHDANIFIAFDNYGKTPGTIRRVCAALFLTEIDQLPEVNFEKLPTHEYQTMVPGETRGKDVVTGALDLKQTITFSSLELSELISKAEGKFRRFVLIGEVVYDDFFGNRHTSRFCVKLRLWLTSMPTAVHMFQVAKGGPKYNRVTTEKIPKNDPLT